MNKVELSQACSLVKWLVDRGFLSETEAKGYFHLIHKTENKKTPFFKTKKESAYMHLK